MYKGRKAKENFKNILGYIPSIYRVIIYFLPLQWNDALTWKIFLLQNLIMSYTRIFS